MSIILRVIFLVCFLTITFVMGGGARAQYAGHVSSLVMNARTGKILSHSDADLQRYPASLTKMMTLYLTFQSLQKGRITLDQRVPISIHAATQKPSKIGMRPGSYITVQQAILALVTKSANDVACALGEFLGNGNEIRFAAYMTSQARYLGMNNTTFQNPSGLPDPDQLTTARDLALLARHLIYDYPQYYKYFSTDQFAFHGRTIANHDSLLKVYYGADGLKTGYTDLAGHNLVTSSQQGRVRLIGVVLGAESNKQRDNTMISLLNQGFISEGQAPQPLIEQPKILSRKRVVARRVQRRSSVVRHRVFLVSYPSRSAHGHVVHHTGVSRRGHHRS